MKNSNGIYSNVQQNFKMNPITNNQAKNIKK